MGARKRSETGEVSSARGARSDAAACVDGILSFSGSGLEALTELLASLTDPESRANACSVLHALAERLECSGHETLSLSKVSVPGLAEPIRLILHPAVFSPEEWGRTFAEGLLKEPEIFDGKKVAELGCGSGWVSILLLQRTGVVSVLGLDINPVAVMLAQLNAWLNGTDSRGGWRLSQSGTPIPLAFRAERSDLMKEPQSRGELFNHIIGCIPQVLHPDPAAMEKTAGSLSDRELYDFSNYCFQQGILEDRFGLPLIARALEQAQLCLERRGRVTLILGGRPGPAAIEAMFRRRGFESVLTWSRRIRQADDTDLASLVELERLYGIKFHFFMSRSSDLPVPASTAVHLLDKGKPVYHDLLVYQATTQYEKPTVGFLRNLRAMGLEDLRREMDFSRVTEEQITFLERLTSVLLNCKRLPYPHERGDLSLRQRLARFLEVYCHHSVDPEVLFVGPERAQLLQLVMAMLVAPGCRVLISASVEPVYGPVARHLGLEVLTGNDNLSELLELDALVAPALSILAPQQLEHPSPIVIEALARHASDYPDRWYVIDDSAHFEIGSSLAANVLVRLTAQPDLPRNLLFAYGLIKNTVCPDLELSFLLNAPAGWSHGLEVGAELTYSRVAQPTELYYEWLLDELLAFPFGGGEAGDKPAVEASEAEWSERFRAAAADPVFAPKPVDPASEKIIRLDYGEFETPPPDLLVKGLIKGFLEPPSAELPEIVRARVSSYIRTTRGAALEPDRVALGQGVFPLLGALVGSLAERLGRPPIVALPDGSYGPCYAAVVYHGGAVMRLETGKDSGFLLEPGAARALSEKPDLIWLTQPNNPSGLYFQPDALRALMRECAEREIYVLADEIFFLLSDDRLGRWTPHELSFAYFLDALERRWLFIADGLSKAFAAGGLRAGFLACPDAEFAQSIQSRVFLPPKSTLRAWDALYSTFLGEAPHQLMNLAREKEEVEAYLDRARHLLSDQRHRLLDLLREHGLDDGLETSLRGGLFLLARLGGKEGELARQAGLLVNPPEWGRTSGWTRLCFSLPPERFDEALGRLRTWLVGAGS